MRNFLLFTSLLLGCNGGKSDSAVTCASVSDAALQTLSLIHI